MPHTDHGTEQAAQRELTFLEQQRQRLLAEGAPKTGGMTASQHEEAVERLPEEALLQMAAEKAAAMLDPGRGNQWCMVCSTMLRGAADKMLRDSPGMSLESALMAALEQGGTLNLAVTKAIPMVLGVQPIGSGLVNGLTDVCWHHVAGMEVRQGLAPANPMEVAALGDSIPRVGDPRRQK